MTADIADPSFDLLNRPALLIGRGSPYDGSNLAG
jgi:hypothetical protein